LLLVPEGPKISMSRLKVVSSTNAQKPLRKVK
jgi:hypothetical protein